MSLFLPSPWLPRCGGGEVLPQVPALWDAGLNGGYPRPREFADVSPGDGGRESGRPAPDLLGVSKLLKAVRQFKYLGGIMSYYEYDTSAVRRNIKKARRTWRQFWKVLEREEVPPRMAGMFYQTIVASVLLYGSES